MFSPSPFVAGMDATSLADRSRGENGTMELTSEGLGNSRVALFFSSVRNTPTERLRELIADCLKDASSLESSDPEKAGEIVGDLFVLAFQTRHCRGGKGEKALFDQMLLTLSEHYPLTVIRLVALIPRFGSYKDFVRLLQLLADQEKFSGIRTRILTVMARQLQSDARVVQEWEINQAQVSAVAAVAAAAAAGGGVSAEEEGVSLDMVVLEDEASVPPKPACKISLCAKYAPREGSAILKVPKNAAWFKELRALLFPDSPQESRMLYRKLIAKLTARLDVTEVKMCAKRFRDIDVEHVPSMCMNRCRKAFLNEVAARPKVTAATGKEMFKGLVRGSTTPADLPAGINLLQTGTRFPLDEDRVACRQHMRAAITGKALTGKQLFPHTIVEQLLSKGRGMSELEKEMMDVQWGKIREDLLAKLAKSLEERMAVVSLEEGGSATTTTTGKGLDMTRLVPLVDVSGSMSGDPMHAAIALGILTSEVNHPAFRDRFITFESVPQWCSLEGKTNIADKVKHTAAAPWGGSTNIKGAFDLILAVIESKQLTQDEIPDLIIFSDMQFDQAAGSQSKTQLEQIRASFAAVGMRMRGVPLNAPRIVFWNLRGDTGGYPASSTDENVQLLSGFSPSLLELALSGEAIQEEAKEVDETDGEAGSSVSAGGKAATKVNPYSTLRSLLDSEKYLVVRKALSRSKEGLLAYYRPAGVEAAPASAAGAQGEDESDDTFLCGDLEDE